MSPQNLSVYLVSSTLYPQIWRKKATDNFYLKLRTFMTSALENYYWVLPCISWGFVMSIQLSIGCLMKMSGFQANVYTMLMVSNIFLANVCNYAYVKLNEYSRYKFTNLHDQNYFCY